MKKLHGTKNNHVRACKYLGGKAMTNLDSILKSRDMALQTKVHIVKAMIFPVVMYRCDSWIIKNAECWRIDAFELWCWRRRLRISWTAKKSNQSILKGIKPEYSLERLMLKRQYFGNLMQRADSLEKTDTRKDWKQKKGAAEDEDSKIASLTQRTWIWANSER